MVAATGLLAQYRFGDHKMANPKMRIHDLETQEIVDREMTNDEYAAHKAALAESEIAAT